MKKSTSAGVDGSLDTLTRNRNMDTHNNDTTNNNYSSSPILHGAIMAQTTSPSYPIHILGICNHINQSTYIRDKNGRLAIHVAAEVGLDWKFDYMEYIVMSNVPAVKENDPVTGLPVYALAAAANGGNGSGGNGRCRCSSRMKDCSLSTIYELLSLCIDDFS